MKEALVVNLFGVPCAGKSTGAAYIFYKLKTLGLNVELVTEFAKDKVWEQNDEALKNQAYIFGQQAFRLSRCVDKVDVIITDKVIKTYSYPIISKNVSRAVHDVKKLGKNCWAARAFDGRETGLYNYKKYNYLIDSPFKISNQCCDIMKKKPLKKYEKQSGNKPIIRTMACESQARKIAWLHNGCNAFGSKNPKSQPMSFWTEQDVLEYISTTGIPYASVYGEIIKDKDGKYHTTKCNRTGCVFCGFGCHLEKEPNRFQRLKETHPKLWNYCMKPWSEGGLGMKEVLEYINVKTE